MMFVMNHGMKVILAVKPVDLRKSFHGLCMRWRVRN